MAKIIKTPKTQNRMTVVADGVIDSLGYGCVPKTEGQGVEFIIDTNGTHNFRVVMTAEEWLKLCDFFSRVTK